MKTATLQHPSTSRVHAQSHPHNDVYWPPRCILKPPCSEQTTRKLRPHTSRPQKAILAWRRAPVVVHLLSRWVCSLGGREGRKRIMFGWCCLLLFLLRGAAFHPLFFGWYRLPFPPLFWEAWCCCSSVDLRVVRLPTVLLLGGSVLPPPPPPLEGRCFFISVSGAVFSHTFFWVVFLSSFLLMGVAVFLPPTPGWCCFLFFVGGFAFLPLRLEVLISLLAWCCLFLFILRLLLLDGAFPRLRFWVVLLPSGKKRHTQRSQGGKEAPPKRRRKRRQHHTKSARKGEHDPNDGGWGSTTEKKEGKQHRARSTTTTNTQKDGRTSQPKRRITTEGRMCIHQQSPKEGWESSTAQKKDHRRGGRPPVCHHFTCL